MIAAFTWISIVAGAVAAGCWLRSATIPITEIVDTWDDFGDTARKVVSDIRQQSRWSAAGAIAAAISVAFLAVATMLG